MGKIVEIIWMDACKCDDHIPEDAARELVGIERGNVGYLVSDKGEYVRIKFGYLNNLFKNIEACDDVFAIPKGSIKKIRELKS